VEASLDVRAEIARLAVDEEKMEKELKALTARLGNPAFIEKANPEIVERDRAASAELADALRRTSARRQKFLQALEESEA
jgi:valyl-tRNA synthetase